MSTKYARTTLPTTPGAIIGFRRNGTPIRLQAGGDGTGAPPAGDPPADPAKPPAGQPPANPPSGADGDGDPAGVDQLGDAGKKALDAMKAERAAAKKELAEAQKRLKEFEDRDKTDSEKLTARAEAAEQRATQLRDRAVRAEVKALAAATFADPSDAAAFLDLGKYAKDDGDIDTEAISADLEALLKSKPHLSRTPGKPAAPRPDPSQGSRPAPPADLDEQIKQAQAKGDWRTAMRLQNSKLADASTTK